MADTWPETLPQHFLVRGYNETEAQNNLLETPEVSVPKSRPLSSAAARNVNGLFALTAAEIEILRTFGRVTIIHWSLPFWFPAHSGAGDDANPGYWLVKFRKDGVPTFAAIEQTGGERFDVALGLYILP